MKIVGASCRVVIERRFVVFACHSLFTQARRPHVRGSTSKLNGDQSAGYILASRTWANSVRCFTTLASSDSSIFALSTGSGRAAIAVIRVSGPACLEIYQSLCPGKKHPKARQATVRTLFEPGRPATLENVLDSSALILYFPAPKTVTGEELLELHVHGGPAIVKAVLSAISKCSSPGTGNIRYAEPGEFTRRAFLNGRLDLTQVEALGDTLAATTEQQRRLSVRGTTSKLSETYDSWRQDLLYARGELEALIDFSEDQHFDESPLELCASVASQVRDLLVKLRLRSQNAVRGEMLRHGISIALLGAPNAGKSSLLNRIVGREAAIVSQEAGTTRDVIEVGLDIGGYLCRIGDTAGLRKAKEELQSEFQDDIVRQQISKIEEEGMRRAKERAAESDVVVVVLSLEPRDSTGSHMTQLHLDPEVLATARHLVREKDNVLVVVNKTDLLPVGTHADPSLAEHGAHVIGPKAGVNGAVPTAGFAAQIMHQIPGLDPSRIHMITCMDPLPDVPTVPVSPTSRPPNEQDKTGVQAFLQGLIAEFRRMTKALSPTSVNSRVSNHPTDRGLGLSDPDPAIWQESLGASERHRILLDECCEALGRFLAEVEGSAEQHDFEAREIEVEADIVVAAEHLRAAAECLAKITGRGQGGDVEEVLGVVFEKFCVGK